eukprot:CFRG0011T1
MAKEAKAEGLMKELQKLRCRSQSFLRERDASSASTSPAEKNVTQNNLAFREVVVAVKDTNDAVFELFVRQQSDWKHQMEAANSEWKTKFAEQDARWKTRMEIQEAGWNDRITQMDNAIVREQAKLRALEIRSAELTGLTP